MIADLPPIVVRDVRAAIQAEYPGDRVSRCRVERPRTGSCRTVTPGGLIVTITDDDGTVTTERADLTVRTRATLGRDGRWRFVTVLEDTRPALQSPLRRDVQGPIRRDVGAFNFDPET